MNILRIEVSRFGTDVTHTRGGILTASLLLIHVISEQNFFISVVCHISFNSASLNLWPIDGLSTFQSMLFCFAVCFLSLLIDFTLLSRESQVSQSILTLVCVHFWDHRSEALPILSPFRCSFSILAWVHRKHHTTVDLWAKSHSTQMSQ